MSKITLIFIFLFSYTSFALADTLIKIKTDEGTVTEVMSNGTITRIDMAPEPGFMLINHKSHDIHMVLPEEKTIMNLSGDSSKGKTSSNVDIKLKAIGNGPKIVGYSTKKYRLLADGQDCGIIYGSKEAAKNADISNIYNAVNEIMDSQTQMMGGMTEMMSPCERAEMNISDQTKITGFPLKTLDENGALTSEILSINTKAKFPANTYTLPSGYKMTSMAEEMRNMQQSMQKSMQQQMPDMEQMMKQMGKSGEMPPEVMEQLKGMENMMKQFQQQ